jgi:phage-related holin
MMALDNFESVGLKAIIFSTFALLNIPPEQVGYLLIIIFADSFLGVIKAVRLNFEISFKRYIWGVSSKLTVLMIPFLLAYFALAFDHNLTFLLDAFIYLLAANETLGIITKIGSIRSGNDIKDTDFIQIGIGRLQKVFTKLMETLTDRLK